MAGTHATCTLPDTVAFVEGTMNGEPYTERHIDEMVANYGRLRGYWSPYVSIDHERGPYSALAFGDVIAVRKGRVKLAPGGGWVRTFDDDRSPGTRAALVTTSRNVPREVGDLINTRRLPRVSIEMFDGTFCGVHGIVPTKVLKSVSLLGARSEASKGMPPPAVQFADRTAVTPAGKPVPTPPRSTGPAKLFGDSPMDPTLTDTPPADAVATPMTREQLIQMFADKGIDTSLITEAVPDALLQAMADLLTADPPPAAPVLDAAGDADMVKAFGDNAPTVKAVLAGMLKRATAPLAPTLAHARTSAANAKAAKIKAFGDRMTGATGGRAYMTPVQFAALRPTLAALDDTAVKTFADKTTGTALDGQLASLAAAFTSPVKTFGDRVADPLADSKGMPSPERRAELLKHTAVGRAVLKAETSTAKK